MAPPNEFETESANGPSQILDSNNDVDSVQWSNGTAHASDGEKIGGSSQQSSPLLKKPPDYPVGNAADDTGARLEALALERSALRDEVTQLRESLEKIQAKHDEDMTMIRSELEERNGEKEHAETQYRNLLGKVNTIRSQLGERLKADAVGKCV